MANEEMEGESQMREERYAADISSIREAEARIRPFIHKTPVFSSQSLDCSNPEGAYFSNVNCSKRGERLFIPKCSFCNSILIVEKKEAFSLSLWLCSGVLQFRGACNAVCSLSDDQAAKGVVTHSSTIFGCEATGNPCVYSCAQKWSEPNMPSRESVAAKVMQETGAVLLHPHNDSRIISGQGTISLELLEQVPQIDTIIAPISGGGLISGVALAAKSLNPAIRVIAAEPTGADDAAQSKAGGKIITLPETNTIADGLEAFLGDLTWPIVRDLVDDIITVEDSEIVKAMKLCYEILKITVEPSGAIGLAVVLSDTFNQNPAWKSCNNIGIILSGGNVDLGLLWNSFAK